MITQYQHHQEETQILQHYTKNVSLLLSMNLNARITCICIAYPNIFYMGETRSCSLKRTVKIYSIYDFDFSEYV